MAVTLTAAAHRTPSGEVRLCNGDIVVAFGKCFMVSTYGSQDDIDTNINVDGSNRNFCSLINLKDGSRVSRNPLKRVCKFSELAMILSPMFPLSHYGAALEAKDIGVVKEGSYNLVISN